MKALSIIFFTAYLIAPLFAFSEVYQQNNDDILVLDKDSEGDYIGTYLYYVRDDNYELDITKVSSPEFSSSFIRSEMERPNFGNEELAIWNKFTVINQSESDWVFNIGAYSIDTLIVYYPQEDGSFKSTASGRSIAFESKPYKTTNYLFDLPVAAGDTTTIYFKVSTYIMQYPISVHTKKEYLGIVHKEDIMGGVYIGFVLLIILYNFLIWISVRDKNYLYYIAYVFLNAMLVFQLNGLVSQFLWIGPFEHLWPHGPFVVALSTLFAYLFTINFLNTRQRTPGIHRFLVYFCTPVLVVIIVMDLLEMNLIASVLNQSIGFIGLIAMFSAAIVAYRGGFQAARFYIIATSFYFTGVVIYVLKTFAILPYNFLTDNSIELGSGLEMALFSLALADRINIYKAEKEEALKENERMVKEQNIVLEKMVVERTNDLTVEKEKSEKLLLNVLPAEIAKELKEFGEAKARNFDSVTVIFSDVEDFTGIAEREPAQDLIEEINVCFKAFDEIMEFYNIEKIKTIGDAYMAADGIMFNADEHAKNSVLAAIEMQEFLIKRRSELSSTGKISFKMRIGLHTGSVVAGIVGYKKFQYDVWGDAVNTAARVESSGEVDKVNISDATYQKIKNEPGFSFISRGRVKVKGDREIGMYYVSKT